MIKSITLSNSQIVLITALATLYYFLVLTDLGHTLARPDTSLNLTFNSMLDHLLRGRFDVDPSTVGLEGFTRNNMVFAYWGIVPALLRIPLIVFPNWTAIDVTTWSCLVATVLALATKLWTLRTVASALPNLPAWMIAAVSAALVLSGAQMGYLRASIFQEVCQWAGFCSAVFVAAVIKGTVSKNFSPHLLNVMALAAGMALLTRVSVAIGLYAALGLLLVALFYRSPAQNFGKVVRSGSILLLFLLICGFVNFQRWGNPIVFADYAKYNYNLIYPDRLMRTQEFGLFNLARIPFGLMYFFAPVWFFRLGSGELLLAATRDRLMDAIELPPSSFLLTDALLIGLAVFSVRSFVVRRNARENLESLAVGLGLVVPPILMLTAISMNYRYRMDFYPLLEFGAFLGLIALGRKGLPLGLTWQKATLAALLVSIGSSHLSMALYRLSDFGPAQVPLKNGIVRFYGSQIGIHYPRLTRPPA